MLAPALAPAPRRAVPHPYAAGQYLPLRLVREPTPPRRAALRADFVLGDAPGRHGAPHNAEKLFKLIYLP